ncbi:uncharacterized protein sS8_4482 [Methylocaldum marinum]|uniref:Uncharacterized protein n=1 Tax=Methylocaldum marinum TaxID=1432792 RepID=A0A250KXT3_9GAMM|nr:uncharacterized protein sS8_4482 [Methylocaldum marinum]
MAVFLGNRFTQEPLTPRILSASAIIIGSVVFINSANRSKPPKKAMVAVNEWS